MSTGHFLYAQPSPTVTLCSGSICLDADTMENSISSVSACCVSMVAIKDWTLELTQGSLNYKFSRIFGCSHRHTPSHTLILHSGEMIGKYEQGDAVPSIEAAKKIADAFGVSLDYLVGEGVNSSFDRKTVKRLQDIEKLQPEDREHIFALMDAFLFKCQVQNSLSV